MTTAASLPNLEQQIDQLESQLQKLRNQYTARQNQLDRLHQQKQQLHAKLQEVEADIAGLTETAAAAEQKLAAPAPTPASAPAVAEQPTLPDLVKRILGDAKQPLNTKEITDKVLARGYQSSSKNFVNLVASTIKKLKKKGIIKSAKDRSGYLMPSKAKQAKAPAPKAKAKTKAKAATGKPSANGAKKGAAATKKASLKQQPSLRDILEGILKKAGKPMPTKELAKRVKATGYHSSSGDFANVVRVMLSKMEEVEHVGQEGYQLKATKK